MHTATVSDDAKAFGGLCEQLAASNGVLTALTAHVSRPQQPEIFESIVLLQRDGVMILVFNSLCKNNNLRCVQEG